MNYRKLFSNLALTVTVTGMTVASIINSTHAQQVLQPGATVNGRVDSSSPPVGVSGGGFRPGVEYTFETQVGDEIQITANREEGSTIDVMLVVIPPNLAPIQIDNDLNGGRQEIYRQNSVSSGGTWKVRVVSFNNQPGNYQLSLLVRRNGVNVVPQQELPYADQVMKRLNLPVTACSTPERVATIRIATETRCTNNYQAGEYTFEEPNQLRVVQAPPPPRPRPNEDWSDEDWSDEDWPDEDWDDSESDDGFFDF